MIKSRFSLSFVLLSALLLCTEAPSQQKTAEGPDDSTWKRYYFKDITQEIIDATKPFVAIIGPINTLPTQTGHLGKSFFRGVYLPFFENRNRPDHAEIDCYFFDDRSDEETAKKFAEKLVNIDNCRAIIGSFDSGSTIAIIDVIKKAKHRLPLLSPVSTATEIQNRIKKNGMSELVWRVNPTNEEMICQGLREFAYSVKGKERYVTSVYVKSPYGDGANTDLKNLANDNLKESKCEKELLEIKSKMGIKYNYVEGVQYQYNEPCPNSDSKDCGLGKESREKIVETLKNNIKQRRPDKPDEPYWNVEVGLFDASAQAGLMVSEIKRQLHGATIFTTSAGGSRDLWNKAGNDADGVIVLTPYNTTDEARYQNKIFKRAFEKNYPGEDPDTFAAQGHDAGVLFMNAIEGLKRDYSRRKIAGALKNARADGAIGPLDLTNGVPYMPNIIIKWQGGELVSSSTSSPSATPLATPMPSSTPSPTPNSIWTALSRLAWNSKVQPVTAALFLVMVFVFLAWLFPTIAHRLVPPLSFLVLSWGALFSGWIPSLEKQEGKVLFSATIVVAVLAAIVAGLVSSTVFREIAKFQPFRHMALLALRNSRLRLRYFTDYLNRLSLKLDDQRVEAYAPMATLIHDG
jgi:ABC-type branched-subunit amino acid transport system substrate-binding protein